MKKAALLFPGQGSQYVGMAKNFCDSFKAAKDTFNEANEALGFDLAKLCFEGNIEELTKTENTQPAILTASVAAFRVFSSEIGIEPVCAAGHSLGELSALCCAGGINFADAVKIVRQRGKFMQEAVPVGVGGMAAVAGVSLEKIVSVCEKVSTEGKLVTVANLNSPVQTVISGNIEAVNKAGESLEAAGAIIIPLKVSAPFHCSLMQPAADRLSEELTKYNFNDMKFPVIANITAEPYPNKESIADYLTKQIVSPVKWRDSMEYIVKSGADLAVELGPKTVLRNLMKKNAPGLKTYSYDDKSDVQALKNQLGSNEQKINNGLEIITGCIAAAVCTKNSNWDEQEYQKGVVEPFRKVKNIREEIKKEDRQPDAGEVKIALDMLKSVFVTKKIPADEQTDRFSEILNTPDLKQQFSGYLN